MTAPSDPRRPVGLGKAGRALWDSITGEFGLAPNEAATLAAACRQADDIALLEAQLKADGPVVRGHAGQPRMNAMFTEVRQGRIALTKMIALIALPTDEAGEAPPLTPAQERARRAARTRWDKVAQLEARREANARKKGGRSDGVA